MLKILITSTIYILLFYIFMFVRGTAPRYKIITLISFFWKYIITYMLLFFTIISVVTIIL